ncbi:MAG: hypothetical protein ACPLRA_01220 [Candidatus Saccharicenans sp.]
MIKKIISIFLSFSFCGLTLVLAQEENLVQLAKKEKDRRESLKAQKVKVVTNKDLEYLTKTPALTLPPSEQSAESASDSLSSPARSTPSVVHRVTVENPQPLERSDSQSQAPASSSGQDIYGSSLEEAWKKAQEYVELLTLKMNALWQQFYSLNDMKTRDSVQLQISDTYEKLLKAQEEEARLRTEYENQINRKKSESASPIWIK